MVKKDKKWIQKAIKHKGSLTKWAKAHGFITKRGTIDIKKAEAYARKHNLKHRIRQINLVKNLKKFK